MTKPCLQIDDPLRIRWFCLVVPWTWPFPHSLKNSLFSSLDLRSHHRIRSHHRGRRRQPRHNHHLHYNYHRHYHRHSKSFCFPGLEPLFVVSHKQSHSCLQSRSRCCVHLKKKYDTDDSVVFKWMEIPFMHSDFLGSGK